MARRLHESTSRGLCRLAFLMMAVIPLIACVCFCAVQFFPSYQRKLTRDWETQISAVTGMDVSIGRVETLKPNSWRLTDVVVKHPESDALVASVSALSLTYVRETLIINAGADSIVQVDGAQFGKTWERLHETLLCQPNKKYNSLVEAQQVTFRSQGAEQQLCNLTMSLGPSLLLDREAPATRMTVQFQLAQSESAGSGQTSAANERTALVLRRSHDDLTTQMLVHTGAAPLPCSLVRIFWPQAEQFGLASRFVGDLLLVAGDDWVASVPENSTFAIDRVDFGSLCWNDLEELGCSGRIQLLPGTEVGQLGVQNLSGIVSLQRGRISRELLLRAKAGLGLELSESVLQSAVRDLSFEAGHLQFFVSQGALFLTGAVTQDASGTLLASRANAMWGQAVPLSNLVHVVERFPAGVGPRSRLAKAVWKWLPIEGQSRTAENGTRLSETLR